MAFGNEVPQRSPDTSSGTTCARAPSITDTARLLHLAVGAGRRVELHVDDRGFRREKADRAERRRG